MSEDFSRLLNVAAGAAVVAVFLGIVVTVIQYALGNGKRDKAKGSVEDDIRSIDTDLYQEAWDEIESGNVDKGLWAKSFAEAEGAEEKCKALYVKHRSGVLKDLRKKLLNVRTSEVTPVVNLPNEVLIDKDYAYANQHLSRYINNPVRIDIYAKYAGLDLESINKLISNGEIRAYSWNGSIYVENAVKDQ